MSEQCEPDPHGNCAVAGVPTYQGNADCLGQSESRYAPAGVDQAAPAYRHHPVQFAPSSWADREEGEPSSGEVLNRSGVYVPRSSGHRHQTTESALLPRGVLTPWGHLLVTKHAIDRWRLRAKEQEELIANLLGGKRASKGQLRRVGALFMRRSEPQRFCETQPQRDVRKMWGIVAANNAGVFVIKGCSIVTFLPFWRRYEGPRV